MVKAMYGERRQKAVLKSKLYPVQLENLCKACLTHFPPISCHLTSLFLQRHQMRLADKKCNKSGLVGDFTEAPADVEIVGDNLGDS